MPLVNHNAVNVDVNYPSIEGEIRVKEVFYNCTFKKIAGAVVKDCTLAHSKVLTDKIEDALGLTVTMDCKTFDDLELSPLLFDLFVVLLLKTRGNDEKRRRLVDILGRERLHELLTEMKQLDS